MLSAGYSHAQNTFPWSATGNVGIGTTNPLNKLSIFEPNFNNTYVTVENNTVSTLFGAAGTAFGLVGTASNHDFVFYTNLKANMRLSVNGKILCTAIKVAEVANWPDYVFRNDYQMPSLAELKLYIDKHQHLPEFPSERGCKRRC